MEGWSKFKNQNQEKLREEFLETYETALQSTHLLAEGLTGLDKSDPDVARLNSQLDRHLANLSEMRERAARLWGLTLSDPFGDPGKGKTV